MAALDPSWRAAGHAWPITQAPARCVLVARTNLVGLLAAQAALIQWASPATRPAVDLLGLVLLADAPGKPPRALRDLAALVAGGAPTTWQVGWVEAWRTDPVDLASAPAAVTRLTAQLRRLGSPPATPLRPPASAVDQPHPDPLRHHTAVKEG